MKKLICVAVLILGISSCKSDDEQPPLSTIECPINLYGWQTRNYKMGFTTWPYGPVDGDTDSTYAFIQRNGDIYTEHMDGQIPWSAWINGASLPESFTNALAYRVAKRNPNIKLLLSVNPLNTERNGLTEDYDGIKPTYESINDQHIEDAYFSHLQHLVDALNPDYLVMGIEANILLSSSVEKWDQYKLLMSNIRFRIRQAYPDLPISESIALHDWQLPEPDSPPNYIQEITEYGENFDFAAISFYPFLENFQTEAEIQAAFDFLHTQTSKPIAFVETGSISEDLNLPTFGISITGTRCGQQDYLGVLMKNAKENNYLFITWWAFADYDKLYATFPPEAQLLGSVWLNTGLIDENGKAKPAYYLWRDIFTF